MLETEVTSPVELSKLKDRKDSFKGRYTPIIKVLEGVDIVEVTESASAVSTNLLSTWEDVGTIEWSREFGKLRIYIDQQQFPDYKPFTELQNW